MSIRNNCMLVSLKVKAWSGQAIDRRITREVHESHSVSDDAGRYTKRLVSPQAFRKWDAATSALRKSFYHETAPWSDSGQRIITVARFFKFTERMDQRIQAVKEAKEDLIQNLPAWMEEAKSRLNSLYDERDYPNMAEIPHMFEATYNVLPFPSGQDFRVDLNEHEVQAMREKIEARIQDELNEANKDLALRVVKTCTKVVEKLSAFEIVQVDGKDKILHPFRDSLIENVREMGGLVRDLNITKDEGLEQMANDLLNNLATFEPDDLRESEQARDLAIAEAERLAEIARQWL